LLRAPRAARGNKQALEELARIQPSRARRGAFRGPPRARATHFAACIVQLSPRHSLRQQPTTTDAKMMMKSASLRAAAAPRAAVKVAAVKRGACRRRSARALPPARAATRRAARGRARAGACCAASAQGSAFPAPGPAAPSGPRDGAIATGGAQRRRAGIGRP
jgi:hypothetical protein